MELESVNYQCPACSGPLRYDSGSGKLVCDYCGSSYEVAEIEALYAAKEEKEAGKAQGASAETLGNGYTCSSCGASLVADGTTAVSTCPYCGNPVVMEAQVAGEFSPDLVIPFKLDHDRAVAALSDYYKGKVLLPKSFKQGNHVDEVQGVYVPFWLYDARTEGSADFEATRVHHYSRGDEDVTETEYYDVRRAGEAEFSRVPVDASSKMPDAHMDAIEPFDYGEMVPFSTAYMPGYVANRWDEDVDACRERAKDRMEQSTVEALKDTVNGYDSVDTRGSSVSCDWKDEKYAMLPVWMLSTSWEGKNFLFAMNGQTGKLVGDLPVSKPKFAGILIGVFAVLFAVMWLILGRSGSVDAVDIAWILAIPIIADIIVGLVLWNQMKTAKTATHANEYLDQGSFRLTGQEDRYRTTTVSRVKRDTGDNK